MPALVAASPLILALTFLVMYDLSQQNNSWLRPIFAWIFKDRRSWWGRVLLKPLQVLASGIRSGVKWIVGIISAAAMGAAAGAGKLLHGLAWMQDLKTLALQRFASEVLLALRYLRNQAIPTLIEVVAKPIRQDARTALATAKATADTVTAGSIALGDGLRALPWGVPLGWPARVAALMNALEHLWDDWFKNGKPAIQRLTTVVIPGLAKDLDRVLDDLYHSGADGIRGIRRRLGELEGKIADIGTLDWWNKGVLAALAALAGVTVGAVSLGIRALFCRNTQTVAQKVCAMDEALLAGLLAGTLTFALVLDPKAVARVGQGVEDTIEGAFRTMADL